MSDHRGCLSKLHTTILSGVAPGTAKAPLAAARGLPVAIPAIVICNMCARTIAHRRALFADASIEILALVSRDLGRQKTPHAGPFDPRPRSVVMPAAESTR